MEHITHDQLIWGTLDYIKWDLFEKDKLDSDTKSDTKSKNKPNFQNQLDTDPAVIYDKISEALIHMTVDQLVNQVCTSFRKTLPWTNDKEIRTLLAKHNGKAKQVFFILFIKYQINCSLELSEQVVEKCPDDLVSATRWGMAEMMARGQMKTDLATSKSTKKSLKKPNQPHK